MRTVPRLCELSAGICLTTEEKARKTHSYSVKKRKKLKAGENCVKGALQLSLHQNLGL